MNIWDTRFQQADYVYGEEPNEFLRREAHQFPPGGEILSLGEGEGRNGVYLAEQGFRVTALDGSSVALDKLRQLAGRRGVRLETRLGDVTREELGAGRWDGIYNVFCHLPSAARAELAGRIRAALRPGGVYLTEQFTPEQLAYQSGGPKDPDMLVRLAELEAAFAGWEIAYAAEERVMLAEGAHHQGPAVVVRFVARKPR